MKSPALTPDLLQRMDAYWRAANYLAVGQLYLCGNPLLKHPLTLADVKHMLLGHWGTTPGQNFIYVHLNRVIKKYDLDMVYVSGPGHGGPAVVGNTYLEGTYSEIYPDISRDEAGLQKLFKQFSFPGGIPSHASPECPGSIHEGGELGYSLSHSFGAVLDNPELIVACVVGDGEAETGPLATAWHSNKFLDPATDGAVLPILHLNGYKIANPTVLARISHEELDQLLRGYGWSPIFVEGSEAAPMHEAMASALDLAVQKIKTIQREARQHGQRERPRWPMIVLRSPKGWTGPKVVDGLPVEGTFRAHQVPIAVSATTPPEHLRQLEDWLRSYRPEELFDTHGRLRPELAELAPVGNRRMGANPHANGGRLTVDLELPDFREYGIAVPKPATERHESTRRLGQWMRDIFKNKKNAFRLFCPDETNSNRLGDVFTVENRSSTGTILPGDDHLAPDGRVMEVLSEHLCQGWLEGYLLTGRHGLFATYEAFAMVSASMTVQHTKWLEEALKLAWRAPIPSLNILLTSTCWRNDHNGFSHQGPGLIDTMLTMKGQVARIYLPPDANCLLSTAAHCLRSRNYVNLIVIDKQPELQWLDMNAAVKHCAAGASIWTWASNEPPGGEPDVVLAAAGDTLTQEIVEISLAADRTQSGLCELQSRVEIIAHLSHRPRGVEHAEINHRVHFYRHVVARDHVLWRDLQRIDAQRHAHNAVDGRENQNESRSLGLRQNAAQAENHAALVFGQNLNRGDQHVTTNNQIETPVVSHYRGVGLLAEV